MSEEISGEHKLYIWRNSVAVEGTNNNNNPEATSGLCKLVYSPDLCHIIHMFGRVLIKLKLSSKDSLTQIYFV